jgi:hypothetical protein
MPFEDGDVEAHWYTWDGNFVVVYAGWDVTTGEPQCPGNSLQTGSDFQFISNSPTQDGSCDSEGFASSASTIVPVDGDYPSGARVCGTLVIYRTIIPTTDDSGAPTAGFLYGTVEQEIGGEFVGATGAAEVTC